MVLFSKQQLDDAVSKALAANPLPAGHNNAIIGGVDDRGVQVVLVAKWNVAKGELDVTGVARHDWTGDNMLGAAVLYSWAT